MTHMSSTSSNAHSQRDEWTGSVAFDAHLPDDGIYSAAGISPDEWTIVSIQIDGETEVRPATSIQGFVLAVRVEDWVRLPARAVPAKRFELSQDCSEQGWGAVTALFRRGQVKVDCAAMAFTTLEVEQ